MADLLRSRVTVAAAAAVALVVAAVLLTRDPPVEVVPVTVEVPTSVDDPTPLALDAALYLPEGASADDPRPAVVVGHGFGSDRRGVDARARELAVDGRVVLTWSARGFGASEGRIDLLDADGGARDVVGLVDLLAERPEVRQDGPGDPVVAIAGASYGGGHALAAATVEPRLDAVVAVAAWHDLAEALAPSGVLKEQWVSVLFTGAALQGLGDVLTGAGGDVAVGGGGAGAGTAGDAAGDGPPAGLGDLAGGDVAGLLERLGGDGVDGLVSAVCGGFDLPRCALYNRVATAGRLGPQDAALLARSSPAGSLARVAAPVLLVQGQQDTLFDLAQSRAAYDELASGPAGDRHALRWVPGGHGQVGAGDPGGRVTELTDAWLDTHLPLAPDGAAETPDAFAWTDEVADELRTTGAAAGAAGAVTLAELVDEGGRVTLSPDGGGLVEGPGEPAPTLLLRPPAALPPSISTLPGLGGVGDLLPTIDLPVQSRSWTTDPLPADLNLVGPVTLDLARGEATDLLDGPIGAAVQDALAGRLDDQALPLPPDDALVLLKLVEVTPGGSTRLLGSHVRPALVAGTQPVTVDLGTYATRVEDGSRLRLTVATTDLAWPVPREPALVDLAVGDLVLATAPPAAVDLTPPAVRIAVPLLLAAALVAAAAFATRRHERSLEAEPDDDDAPPVRIRGLRKEYADGKVAVDGLDLDVGHGQVVGLLGPNGAGKTTTMRMLLGLIHPTAGEIEVFGHPMRPGHPVLRRVGVLVEGPGFVPTATGRQNLRSFWEAGGGDWADADVERALEVADLGAAVDRPTRTYSHGMRQRLAIAQALLGRPELLVLDEPTDGLDPEQIRAMRELLARLGQEGVTVLVSSHLLAEVEQMCTHVVVVRAGTAVAAGSVAELLGATRSVVVRTDDRERATAVLADAFGEDVLDLEADGLVVDVEAADVAVADVVEALVGAGVRVDAVTPRGRLEDTFLALTGSHATAEAEGPDTGGRR